MGKLIQLMADIPKDKLLHSFYGTLLYSLLSIWSLELALWVVLITALCKEFYDEYKYGRFDYMDILATVILPYLLYLKEVFYG